jgi:hypothetical protein
LRDAPTVHGAVPAEVEATEEGGTADAAFVRLVIVARDAQHAAAVRQVHPAARRRRPLVGVVWRKQFRCGLDQIGRFGDHRVGRVGRAGVVLQRPDGLDEPAVVGSAVGGGLNWAEIAAAVFLCVFGGHTVTVLRGLLAELAA